MNGLREPSDYMTNKGHISLHRRIRDHWVWKDPKKLKWWIDILLEVNHKADWVNIEGHLIKCDRGQSVKSIRTWAERWEVDRSTARRFFELLKNDCMVKTESLKRTTKITVCKYHIYQKAPTQQNNSRTDTYKNEQPNLQPTSENKTTKLLPSNTESYKDNQPSSEEENDHKQEINIVYKGKEYSENSFNKAEQKRTVQTSKFERLDDSLKIFPIKGALKGQPLTEDELDKVQCQCKKYLSDDINLEDKDFLNQLVQKSVGQKER